MRKNWVLILLPVALIIAAAILIFPHSKPKISKVLDIGQKAPDWSLKEVGGGTVTLSQFKDKKGVILAFFATWCPYCMEEVPELKDLQSTYGNRGVAFFAVNIEQPEHVVKEFMSERGVNYKVLLDADGSVSAHYGWEVTGIPLIVGIDAEGTVQYVANALPKSRGDFMSSLEPAVAVSDTPRSQ